MGFQDSDVLILLSTKASVDESKCMKCIISNKMNFFVYKNGVLLKE